MEKGGVEYKDAGWLDLGHLRGHTGSVWTLRPSVSQMVGHNPKVGHKTVLSGHQRNINKKT